MKILLVDDDPLILRTYGDGLRSRGFQVERAEDGLEAAKILHRAKPDAIVLDLMMPKLSGLEVLKYIRSRKDLAKVPVVIFSNAYMNELGAQAVAAGADMGLFKVACTPAVLADTLEHLIRGDRAETPKTDLLVVPAPPAAGRAAPQGAPREAKPQAANDPKPRQDFLKNAPAMLTDLRKLFLAFHKAGDADRALRLEDLYATVHFLTNAACVGECPRLAQMASVLEALLSDLSRHPAHASASVLRTIATAVDFLETLSQHDRNSHPGTVPASTLALVLDDDAVCRRVTVSALRNAHFLPEEAGDPVAALPTLGEKQYGLIILDIEMPGMDGLEFCRQVRRLPGYQKTPVIYVTSHDQFELRVKGALSGAQDLIAKPILPMELAVKAVTQTLMAHLESR